MYIHKSIQAPIVKCIYLNKVILIHRRRKRGGGGGAGGARPPNNLRGGATYPLAPLPLNNPPTCFFNFYVKQEKNHKCTKLKGKMIINVTLI